MTGHLYGCYLINCHTRQFCCLVERECSRPTRHESMVDSFLCFNQGHYNHLSLSMESDFERKMKASHFIRNYLRLSHTSLFLCPFAIFFALSNGDLLLLLVND